MSISDTNIDTNTNYVFFSEVWVYVSWIPITCLYNKKKRTSITNNLSNEICNNIHLQTLRLNAYSISIITLITVENTWLIINKVNTNTNNWVTWYAQAYESFVPPQQETDPVEEKRE